MGEAAEKMWDEGQAEMDADQIEITCIFCRDGWLDPVLDKWAYKKGEAKVRKKCTTCKGGARIMWPKDSYSYQEYIDSKESQWANNLLDGETSGRSRL